MSPAIQAAIAEEQTFRNTKSLWSAYEAEELARRDFNAQIDFAKQEGRSEGRDEAYADVALKLYERNSPFSEIKRMTGLDEKQVLALASEHGITRDSDLSRP